MKKSVNNIDIEKLASESEDTSGLYELSGLKEIFELADKEKDQLKKEKAESFWKEISSEKDMFEDDFKPYIPPTPPPEDEIDPFWLS